GGAESWRGDEGRDREKLAHLALIPKTGQTSYPPPLLAGSGPAPRLGRGGVFVLVGGAVFKTVERQSLSLVGSIPIRLRDLRFYSVRRPSRTGLERLNDLRVPFACHNSGDAAPHAAGPAPAPSRRAPRLRLCYRSELGRAS